MAGATGSARKVAILGEMLELGEHAASRCTLNAARPRRPRGLDLLDRRRR